MKSKKFIINFGNKYFKQDVLKRRKLSKDELYNIAFGDKGNLMKLYYYKYIHSLTKKEEKYINNLIIEKKKTLSEDVKQIADDLCGKLDDPYYIPSIVKIAIGMLLQRGIIYWSNDKNRKKKTLDWDMSDEKLAETMNITILNLLEHNKNLFIAHMRGEYNE